MQQSRFDRTSFSTNVLPAFALALLLLGASGANAQFSGTVINIPPDPDIGDHSGIGSHTQVNVRGGGKIGLSFDVGDPNGTSTNAELNVLGGIVGNELHANAGSTTNVMTGTVGNQMAVFGGSVVNVSGGRVGNGVTVLGGELNVSGGEIGSDLLVDTDSLVNISGGLVGHSMDGGRPDGSSSGVAINVSGGRVRGIIDVWKGSHTTVTGGVFILFFGSGGDLFNARAFSFVEVFGGIVDYDFDTFTDADVHFYGNDFLLNGEPLAVNPSFQLDLGPDDILEGVLADGTPFALGAPLDDEIAQDTLTLHTRPLPPIGATMICLPPDPPPLSIRDGQTLKVLDGGTLGDLFRAGRGSTLQVMGGTVGAEAQAIGAHVSISSGRIGQSFVAIDSDVEITGGTIGSFFEAGRDSVVNISGGDVATYFANPGSETNITGGNVNGFFLASGEVNISGGSFVNVFSSGEGSNVNVFGSEFRLNGELIAGLETPGSSKQVNVPESGVLSGTLSDGTPILFSVNMFAQSSDLIADGTLTLHATSVVPAGPPTLQLPGSSIPAGLREGQTLTINQGGEIGEDVRSLTLGYGSTLNMLDGFVSPGIEAVGATVNKSGGISGGIAAWGGSNVKISGGMMTALTVGSGSEVDITGGYVFSIEAFRTAKVNVSGGLVERRNGRAILADTGSELNISGGTISGRDLFISTDAVANISGGVFDLHFLAGFGSEINLAGSSFLLDGEPIAGLQMGMPLTIADRDVTLTGTWANGQPFTFDLSSMNTFTTDFFDPTAILTVTLVEPNLLPGDFSGDGVVNTADYVAWRNAVGSQTTLAGDTTPGSVTQADYEMWRANFGNTRHGGGSGATTEIPEPATIAVALVGAIAAALKRRSGNATCRGRRK